MEDKNFEVAKEIVDFLRAKHLTVAEIRNVLADINEVLDSISVLMEKPHTGGAV